MRFPLLARTWDFLIGTKTGREGVRRPTGLSVLPLEDRITPTGRPLPLPFIFAGAGSGPPLVRAYHADTGELAFERQPFDAAFTGGVRVAAGDIDADGIPDLIAAAGPSGGPAVTIYSGKTGEILSGPLGSFYAYDPSFTGGLFVASGDVDGDGHADVITAAGAGGSPHVKVFSGATGELIASFHAFDTAFRGGATVSAADFTGDGKADLVVGAGAGGGPNVRVFDLNTGDPLPPPLGSFFAFDESFTGGVEVGTDFLAGDVTGDGVADIVVGTGPGTGSLVRVFDGVSGDQVMEFSPFGAGMTAGVRVGTAFVDDDPYADVVVGTGAGVTGLVRVFSGATAAELSPPLSGYAPFGPGFTGGLFIGASNDPITPGMTISASTTAVEQGGTISFTFTITDPTLTNTPTGTVAVSWTEQRLGELTATLSELSTGVARATVTFTPVVAAVGAYAGQYAFYTPTNEFESAFDSTPGFTVIAAMSQPGKAVTPYSPAEGCGCTAVSAGPAEGNTGTPAAQSGVKTDGSINVSVFDGLAGGVLSSVAGWLSTALRFTNASGYEDAAVKTGSGVVGGLPRLTEEAGGLVALTETAGSVLWFNGLSGVALFGYPATLTHDTVNHELVLADATGAEFRFHDFSGSVPTGRGGRLKQRTDAAGNVAEVTAWGANGQATELQMTDAGSAAVESLVWVYDGSDTLTSLTRRRKIGAGSWATVRSAEFHYATVSGVSDAVLAGTALKDGSGTVLAETYNRYYSSADPLGYAGGLKYQLGVEATARLKAAYGASWAGLASLTDAQVAAFADRSFEYSPVSRRVTRVVAAGAGCSACSGGQGTADVTYTVNPSPGSGVNDWAQAVTVSLDDGTTNTSYANGFGQTLLETTTDGTTTWRAYTRYDADGRVVLQANPSAVTGHSEGLSDLVGWSGSSATYLNSSSGLIATATYGTSTTATTSTAGDVTGYLKSVAIQNGTGGTPVPQSATAYVERAAGGISTYHTAAMTAYRNDNGTGARTTSYAYTWFAGTHRAESVTVTLPTVTAGQNGPGAAASGTTVYDLLGRPIWTKDAAGVLSYTAYDPGTGAVVKAIADVNTANTSDFANLPSGWSTPGGAGQHLVSAAEVDLLGRTTKATDPLGQVTYVVFDDVNWEARVYAGWTGTGPTGPTVVSRADTTGRYTETLTMTATPAVSGGRPTGTESVSGVQSLTRSVMNNAGQVVAVDAYQSVGGYTAASPVFGTAGATYLRTEYGYDQRGRANKVVTPAGVLTRVEYDALGRATSTWIGTHDEPSSGFWAVNNTAGTDMVKVSAAVYDAGGPGDSNLTAYTEYPNHGRTARVTQVAYDWRNRPVATKTGSELLLVEDEDVNRPIAFATYDNLGAVLTSAVYDGDGIGVTSTAPNSALRRAYTVYSYDEYGRNYQVDDYGVNQTTGALATTPLTSQVWFDLRGLDVKSLSPDGQVVKTGYDSLGRPVATYLTDGGGDATWADALTVTGDTVWAQSEVAYDAASRVIQTTDRERFDGETGTGVLGTATTGVKARVTSAGYYYDQGNRLTAMVDVGTNGGTAWTRPGTVPARSDTALVTSVAYGANGLPLDVTDPRGLTTRTVTDLLGRTTSTTAAFDTSDAFTVTNTYDSAGRLRLVTAPGARTTKYLYDELGRVGAVVERTGTAYQRRTNFEYDDLGGLIRETDAYGTKTEYATNALGEVVSVTAAAGTALARTASTAFDTLGRTVSVTDPRGNVTGYAYDDIARTATTTDALGYAWTTAFDKAGRVTSQTDPYGKSMALAYDLPGRVVSVTDALSHATTFAYNVSGSEDRVTDALSHTTAQVYDRFGRVASVRDALGNSTAFTYDRNSNVATVTDAKGVATAFTYDNLDRTISVTEAVGKSEQRTTTSAYNAFGDLAKITDPLGRETAFGYDTAGRMVSQTAAANKTEAFTVTTKYDLLDRVVSVTAPGSRTTAYDYDLLGQMTTVTEAVDSAVERTSSFTYDANGNRLTVTDPLGFVTATAYDKLNRATSVTDANGGVTEVAFDKAGRRVSLTDPTGNVTQWGYDAANRLTSETDPRGKVTGYAYDAADRLVTVTDRVGQTRNLSYDAAGRLTQDQWKASGGATLQTNSYTYDANGNQLTAVNGNASYTLGYDNLNRVVSVAGPFGVDQAFTYDAADNRLTATDDLGGVTTSTYDDLDRLTSRTLSVSGTNSLKAEWTYTAAGDVGTQTRWAWVGGAWSKAGTTAYTTDPLGRTVGIVHKNAADAPVGGASYVFDAGDRITSQTINGVEQTFGYDDLGQITDNGGTKIAYDASGNRTTNGSWTVAVDPGNRVTADGVWTYAYNDLGQVTGKSKSGEAWAYTYDLNGQMTAASKSATVGGAVTDSVAYAYDAWGNRVSRTQTGTTSSTERYVVDGWDTAKPGARGTENFDVTLDLNGSNAVTARRVFGAGFDAAVARRDAGGAVSWYGADALGSVRQVFDNSGAVTGSRTFDGFGNVTGSTGTGLDRYGYTGTVTDPLTGLVGDNARVYEPVSGRWLSQDPIGFSAGDANLYRYVGNNATGATDPSGMDEFARGFLRGLFGPGAAVFENAPQPPVSSFGAGIGNVVAGAAAGITETAEWVNGAVTAPPPTDQQRIATLRLLEKAHENTANTITGWQRDVSIATSRTDKPLDQLAGGIINGLLDIPKSMRLMDANSCDVSATRLEEKNGIASGPSSSDRRYSFNMALLTENPIAKLWRTYVPGTGSQYMNQWAYEAEYAAPRNYERGTEAAPGLMELAFLAFDIVTLPLPFLKLLRGVNIATKFAPRALRVGGEVGLERMNIAARIAGQAEKQVCKVGTSGLQTTHPFAQGERLSGVAAFDQLVVDTPAFRSFIAKLERHGYTVEPRTFKDINRTVAQFDGKLFSYDPASFRIFHLLHENRHFSQLYRAKRLGLGDLMAPHAMGQGRIRKLLETEAYMFELWIAKRHGFSPLHKLATRELLDQYMHATRNALQYSSEFREFATKLLGYDLLPYILKYGK